MDSLLVLSPLDEQVFVIVILVVIYTQFVFSCRDARHFNHTYCNILAVSVEVTLKFVAGGEVTLQLAL
jgi:hypothetical protein